MTVPIALGALSSSPRATMEALNAMQAVEDSRPLWKRYAISLLLSLAVGGLLVGALLVVVSGSRIAEALADGSVWGWALVQWPALLVAVSTAFALVYYFAPDVRQRFRWIRAGTLIALALWLIFAGLFALYVDTLSSFNKTYGTLAGVAVLLVYVYCCSFILLLDAEINQIIELHDPDGKNEGEKVPDGEKQGAVAAPSLR